MVRTVPWTVSRRNSARIARRMLGRVMPPPVSSESRRRARSKDREVWVMLPSPASDESDLRLGGGSAMVPAGQEQATQRLVCCWPDGRRLVGWLGGAGWLAGWAVPLGGAGWLAVWSARHRLASPRNSGPSAFTALQPPTSTATLQRRTQSTHNHAIGHGWQWGGARLGRAAGSGAEGKAMAGGAGRRVRVAGSSRGSRAADPMSHRSSAARCREFPTPARRQQATGSRPTGKQQACRCNTLLPCVGI